VSIILTCILLDIGWKCVDWIDLVQHRDW
jgi:hypothetical protein